MYIIFKPWLFQVMVISNVQYYLHYLKWLKYKSINILILVSILKDNVLPSVVLIFKY